MSGAGLRDARGYLQMGVSVLPLRPRDKRPLIRWTEFQHRRPTEAEVRAWWRAAPAAGVGIVCGRVSSLIVLDDDPRNSGPASLAPYPAIGGPRARTGGGGGHSFLAHMGERIPKTPGLLPGVDLQAEGSYVVAPPSIHPNGTAYAWEPGRALGAVLLPSIPFWLRCLIRDHQRTQLSARGHGAYPGAPLDLIAVLDRLSGVRQASGGWMARCPAHEDGSPSLSIGLSSDGRVLLNCFAGCAYRAIRAALDQEATG